MPEIPQYYERIPGYICQNTDIEQVEHRKGTCQQNADSLSRMKGLEESADQDPLVEGDYLQDVDEIYVIVPAVSTNKLQDTIESLICSNALRVRNNIL